MNGQRHQLVDARRIGSRQTFGERRIPIRHADKPKFWRMPLRFLGHIFRPKSRTKLQPFGDRQLERMVDAHS